MEFGFDDDVISCCRGWISSGELSKIFQILSLKIVLLGAGPRQCFYF